MKDDLPEIITKKPWITAEDASDVFSKIDELTVWVE
jgi:hypothetical protein